MYTLRFPAHLKPKLKPFFVQHEITHCVSTEGDEIVVTLDDQGYVPFYLNLRTSRFGPKGGGRGTQIQRWNCRMRTVLRLNLPLIETFARKNSMSMHYTVTKLIASAHLTELNLATSDAVRDGWVVSPGGFAHLGGQFTSAVSTEVEQILMPLGNRLADLLSVAQDLYAQRAKEMYSSLRLSMDAQVTTLERETRYDSCTSAEQGHFEFDGRMFALARCVQRQFEEPFLAVIRYHRPMKPALQSHSVYQQ